MRMKQVLGVLMAAVMTTGLLAGCGKEAQSENTLSEEKNSTAVSSEEKSSEASVESTAEEEDSIRISDEVITITVAGRNDRPDNIWNDTIQFAEYEKQLGLKFDATTYNIEQWSSKLTLMMASDELPDMLALANMSASDVAKYGKDGYFLDFSEYLDIMPNLKAIMDQYPEYAKALKDENGHIYALCNINNNVECGVQKPTFLYTRWLDNLGLEMPESLDELYDVLVAFKEQDANGNGDPSDEIPFGYGVGSTLTENPILWSFGIYSWNTSYYLMADENGKVSLGDISENYKDFLRYMNKLYENGLMGPNPYTLSSTELVSKFTAGQVGMNTGNNTLPEANESQDRMLQVESWSQVGSFTSEYSDERVLLLTERIATNYDWAVSADTEYAEEICRFLDWCYTEEGYIAARFGFEGITFDWTEFFGVDYCEFTEYKNAYTGSVGWDNSLRAIDAFTPMDLSYGGSFAVLDLVTDEELRDPEIVANAGRNVLREEVIRSGVTLVDDYPLVKYTDAELKERATLYADLNTYLLSAKAAFITGTKDIDADWEAHVAELYKIGLERLLEIEQAAYDRYMAL